MLFRSPFLRTVGTIIDMRDGIIRYQFPLKKGMEHFPKKRKKSPFDSVIRTSYELDLLYSKILDTKSFSASS